MPNTPKTTTKRKPSGPHISISRAFTEDFLAAVGVAQVTPTVNARHVAACRQAFDELEIPGYAATLAKHFGKRPAAVADSDDLFAWLVLCVDYADPLGMLDADSLRGVATMTVLAFATGFGGGSMLVRRGEQSRVRSANTARRNSHAERDARIRERFESERSKGRKATAAHLTLAREFRVSIDTVRRACRRPPG